MKDIKDLEAKLALLPTSGTIDPETCPFVTKANHLIRKYGFTVSGKPPLEKMTDVSGWNRYNRLYKLTGNHSPVEFIRKNLKNRPWFAYYEVVVFCECRERIIGHNEDDGTEDRKMGLFVFDIDAKGVLEKVEGAIGPLPYGLTVQSRPKSAPRIEGQWDAKGSGAGGYVVSGDTPREGDEAVNCSML